VGGVGGGVGLAEGVLASLDASVIIGALIRGRVTRLEVGGKKGGSSLSER